jgi:hypothetical protein
MFDKLRKAKDEGGRMKDEKIHPSAFILHPSSESLRFRLVLMARR